MARAPALGDRMIVTKEPYSSLITVREKIMELRRHAIRGEYYLADSITHKVKAKLTFGEAHELTQEEYEKTRDQHCVEHPIKRYKKTVGTVIASVQQLAEEVSYKAKRGAIGFARFQPFIPKTLRIMKMRKDSLGESHGGVNARAVQRKSAKVKDLPAAGVPRQKGRRLKMSVSAPVLSEPLCSGATAIEVVPALSPAQREFQVCLQCE